MKRVLEYIYNSICKNLILAISVFLLLVVGIFSSITITVNYKEQNSSNEIIKKILGEHSYCQLIENFTSVDMDNDHEENLKLLEKKEKLYTNEKLYFFYKELQKKYKLIETEEYVFQYNDEIINDKLSDIRTIIEGEECEGHENHEDQTVHIGYNALMVNEQFYDEINIKFKNSDYIDEEYVPVILGSKYKDKINIGETISIRLNEKNINIKVVDYLPSNKQFIKYGGIINLDNYIILPLDNIEVIKEDRNKLINRINNTLIISENPNVDKLLAEVNEIALANGLGEFEFIDYRYNLQVFQESLKDYLYTMGVLSLLCLIFSVVSIISITVSKISINIKEYGVHLISGASMNDIKSYILAEISIFVLVASFFAIYFSGFNINMTLDLVLKVFVFDILIIGIISIIPIYKINKINISELLRRNN